MPVPFSKKTEQLNYVKRRVAEEAWELFIKQDPNPRILIDAGSSANAIAEVIAERLTKRDVETVVPTVFTHNLAAWKKLSQSDNKVDLYLIGGRYTPDLNAVIEPDVYKSQLEKWTPNIAIIAVSGIDSAGLYCSNIQDEAPVKETLAGKKVEKRIILCDHSKIGKTDVKNFISLEALKDGCPEVFLVTDKFDWMQVDPPYRQDYFKETLEQFKNYHGDDSVIEVVVEKSEPGNDNGNVSLGDENLTTKNGNDGSSTQLRSSTTD